jgi:cytochrome c biogenesis protein
VSENSAYWRRKLWGTASSIRTGIVLLIVIGTAAAAGTLILQRPITDPEKLAQAYRPETLAWLDRLGLTDVYHSWWFVLLLGLLCLNVVFASLERFPGVWRYFARPYRRPDASFQSSLALRREIPVRDAEAGIEAAERAFRRMGFSPQRVRNGHTTLYAERHRVARLAAYVVHLSLLLILGGGIVDAVWGYRGFVALTQDEQVGEIELRDGSRHALPFLLRCDGSGQENYPDGTPRRWWTRLTVLEQGQAVKAKEIEVNNPLVHRGLRFFQASYGSTGEPAAIELTARRSDSAKRGDGEAEKTFRLGPRDRVALDDHTSVHLASFVPDFVMQGGQILTRSWEPRNPAIQLCVESERDGEAKLWLFPRFPDLLRNDGGAWTFEFRDLEMGYYSGLQVAYEPGQWAVWTGCVLMGLGLIMAFYMVHVRVWAVPVSDDRGRVTLWLGAAPSKNRAEFEHRFARLAEAIESELASGRLPARFAAPAARA